MWLTCLLLSMGCPVLAVLVPLIINYTKLGWKKRISTFYTLFAGVFAAVVFMFYPILSGAADVEIMERWGALLLSAFYSMQVFTIGCDFNVIKEGMIYCPNQLDAWYQIWTTILFVAAPIFTFGFVLSLFKNLSAYLKYLWAYYKDVYIFSELNDRSLALASDIKENHPKAVVLFADVFEDNEEQTYEISSEAKSLGAICFKKDILAINFHRHSGRKALYFFTIGNDETENMNQAIRLIEEYRNRANTHVYMFSSKIESELLMTTVDKGKTKVRRINEVRSLVNRTLYEQGDRLFCSARAEADGKKKISAVVVGMGNHGRELVKALTWYGQMDGYRLEIHAYDKDPLAEEKMIALAPELMSPDYNGVEIEGEAQYKITVHSGVDVESNTFRNEIAEITDATFVIVALGNDDINVRTAVNLRMYFERMKIHPVIQAIVYNTQQRKALEGIRNYRGQAYDIAFIGDMESSYTEAVIMDSKLENEALQRHLKWGKEEEFWTYEYNYRSSIASAIHMGARIQCGIPGADKREEDLTPEEKIIIETLEHRRWNAYMRAEGYIFSGSTDRSSRNDLAKMHHDLVDYASLPEEVKRIDSKVGTK